MSLIRDSKQGRGVLVFIIRGLYRSTSSSNQWSTILIHDRPCFEIFVSSCAHVKYISEAMAKSLSEFVPTFERLTHNPEDYLRYDSNV